MARRTLHRVRHRRTVLHQGDEAVARVDAPITAAGRCDGDEPAFGVRAGRAAPRDAHCPALRARVHEGVEVAQPDGVSRRKECTRHDDPRGQHGRQRIEALAVARETEAAQVLIRGEHAAVCLRDADLQIAEAIEGARLATGRHAAAVLRPRRGILDVPVLPVGIGQRSDGMRGRCEAGCSSGECVQERAARRSNHATHSRPDVMSHSIRLNSSSRGSTVVDFQFQNNSGITKWVREPSCRDRRSR